MSVLDLFNACRGKKLILHRREVFFNTRTWEEAREWELRGARLVPWHTLDALELSKRKGRELTPGWEVHVIPMLDPDWEEGADGEEIDMAPEKLRELCRTS